MPACPRVINGKANMTSKKCREIEEIIARFEADAARYRDVATEKARLAEMWRRYLGRKIGEVEGRESRVESKEGVAA